jgi:hypothetical protein
MDVSPSLLTRVVGPRVAPAALAEQRLRFVLPTLLLLLARILILVSLFLPYWHMELHAPQYPDHLKLHAFVNHLAGDVAEIDGLNHYIGMRPLEEAAEFERSVGVYAMILFAVMLEAAAAVHSRWVVLLALPVVLFPMVFLVDLHLWMSHFGMNLDPDAPLSAAVDPFVPPVLGTGTVGQFQSVASPGIGLWMTATASLVILVALYFHRRAYKPLHVEMLAAGDAAPGTAR